MDTLDTQLGGPEEGVDDDDTRRYNEMFIYRVR